MFRRCLTSYLGLTRNNDIKLCGLITSRSMRLYRERTVRLMYWRGRSFDAVKYEERRKDQWQDWNYRSEIFAFSRRLQENLSQDTLRKVFVQKSYVDQILKEQEKFELPRTRLESNEHMVERGYTLLDECLKLYMRHSLSKIPEDGITAIVDYLKSEPVGSDIAKWLGCRDLILTTEWPPTDRVMSDTVAALLAGIEMDLGLQRVQRFVVDMIATYIHDKNILEDIWKIPNPNETLQLILKNSNLPPYEPRIIFQTGIRTLEACHIIGLYVNQQFMAMSPGETLEIAERCAALKALEGLFGLTDDKLLFIYGETSEKIDYNGHTTPHKSLDSWSFALNS